MMPLRIETVPITDGDRRLIHEQLAKPWQRSPALPILAAITGAMFILWAFWIWPRSMEGAAALVFFGASMLAAGGWIANERWTFRKWQAAHRRAIETEMQRGEAVAVTVESISVRWVPEYDEHLSAALFRVADNEHILLTDEILTHFPGYTSDAFPAAFSFRMLPKGTLISVSFSSNSPIAPIESPLTEAETSRLLDAADASDQQQGVFMRVPEL